MSNSILSWPSEIVFVRHGLSTRNAAKACTMPFYDIKEPTSEAKGIPDHRIPLVTPKGFDQARAAGKGIAARHKPFDIAFHSGYLRVKQTLDCVLEAYGDAPRPREQTDLLLRERVSGYGYDMYGAEAVEHFPWQEAHWNLFGNLFACPPGGESVPTAIDRVNSFLLKLRLDHAGKRVLISTHGRILACFRHVLEGWSWEQTEKFVENHNPERPKNCGVTFYQYSPEENRMVLKEYNTVYH